MTTHRYAWPDVQRAADLFFRTLADSGYSLPPQATGLEVSPGSTTNGQSGCLTWRSPEPFPLTAPYPTVPGGAPLPRNARDAFDNLHLRIRMVEDLNTYHYPTRKG